MKHIAENMDAMDFSKYKQIIRPYGGSDRKFAVVIDDHTYMLKFAERHAKKTDMSTKYVNSVVSEYISSHICETIGIPVHETILGTYRDEVAVACRDFRENGDENIEFSDLLRISYSSSETKKAVTLDQIYSIWENPDIIQSDEVRTKSIKRFWDTFVVDSLVGNFDRHPGNWGYLSNSGELRLAPVYDFGSTLLPQLADEGMEKHINNNQNMLERCLVFPSPVMYITKEKVGKVGYYDMLTSGYNQDCNQAIMRIVPNVNIDKINNIIDRTPLISDIRRNFYKKYIGMRKVFLLDNAYEKVAGGNFDKKALERIQNGISFGQNELKIVFRSLDNAGAFEQFDTKM